MSDRPPLNVIDRPGQPLSRKTLAVNGTELAYVDEGSGPPVVLLHGTMMVLEDMMLGLAPALRARCRIIAFDRPGFGRSQVCRLSDAGIRRQALTLLQAIEALGLDRPIVVGHSFGASVALTMAVERPDQIGGVVALAPLVLPEPRLEHLLFGPRSIPGGGDLLALTSRAGFDRLLLPILWRAMFLPQDMPRPVLDQFPFALAGRGDALIRVAEDAMASGPGLMRLLSRARNCQVPARIFGGDRDLVVRNGVNGRMLAAIMPQVEFVDLAGLGHMIHHFASARIADAVACLVREASAGP